MIGLVHSRFSGDNVCHGNDKDQDSVGNLHSSFVALNDVDAFLCVVRLRRKGKKDHRKRYSGQFHFAAWRCSPKYFYNTYIEKKIC